MQNQKTVLILGSKYGSKLPNIEVDLIYSANGAAERASEYKKIYPNTYHTALVGGKYFLVADGIKERVIESKPNKLIVRAGPIQVPEEFIKYNCEIIQWDRKEGLKIQSQYFKLGWLDIVFGEIMFYESDFISRLRHLHKCLKFRGFLGCSTGLFAIFFAAMENPNAKIITSGIGLTEGRRFYEEENTYGWISRNDRELAKKGKLKLNKYNNVSRFRVERFLSKRVKNHYKSNIVSLDKEFVNNAFGKLWDGETF
tara:strand:+ start:648 stop:1412 length:765 start_codon:yes stop_codon:yes gene_type:complete